MRDKKKVQKNFMIKEYEGEEITNLFFWASDEKQAEGAAEGVC